MIVLRTPKGWTGPREVDGLPVEGTFRAHQVPLAKLAENPQHVKALEAWMRSYRPEELFDEQGRPRPDVVVARARGRAPHGRQPARQRRSAPARPAPAGLPRLRGRGAGARQPTSRGHARAGRLAARRDAPRTRDRFRIFGPDETASNRLGAVLEVTDRAWMAGTVRRRRPPRPRGPGDGGALRAPAARAGSRATCSPGATACSTATRRSSTSSTRCSTSTPSGSRPRATSRGDGRSRP